MKTEATRGAQECGGFEIEYLPVEKLNPAPYNPRQMPPEEMEALKRSIQRFGCVEPLIVQLKGLVIIGGHQRAEAARQLGFTTVPVVLLDVTDAEAKTLNLALNKIQGKWVFSQLATLLAEIRVEAPDDLEVTGFFKDEANSIIRILNWNRYPDPDDLGQLSEEPTSRPGDLWVLGSNMILCGDSSDPRQTERLLESVSVALLVTDPPYGINYDSGQRPGARKPGRKVVNDDLLGDRYRELLTQSLSIAFAKAAEGAPAYCFHAATRADDAIASFKAAGWHLASSLVWIKPSPTFSRDDYRWGHEPILYGWKPGRRHRWYGEGPQSTVWCSDREPSLSGPSGFEHPTVKPVSLLQRMVSNSSLPGDVVYDPFLGSGSTLITCERLGRRCLGVEIDPRCMDLAIARWERQTGQKAELAGR